MTRDNDTSLQSTGVEVTRIFFFAPFENDERAISLIMSTVWVVWENLQWKTIFAMFGLDRFLAEKIFFPRENECRLLQDLRITLRCGRDEDTIL